MLGQMVQRFCKIRQTTIPKHKTEKSINYNIKHIIS